MEEEKDREVEDKPLIKTADFSSYKKEKLTRQQINKALMDIEDTNPLRERVNPTHIAGCLTRCFKQKNKTSEFKYALRQVLLQELKFKVPRSEDEIFDDPYVILGYGVNAYYDILFSLCIMFACITIFCIPIYLTYQGGVYYRD